MSTNYIVTAQKPTAVTACVTGKIQSIFPHQTETETYRFLSDSCTLQLGYRLCFVIKSASTIFREFHLQNPTNCEI